MNTKIEAKLIFLKINTISKEILNFYEKFFTYFGYNVEKVYNRNYFLKATNDELTILLDNGLNINPKIRRFISRMGISGIYFRVKNDNQVNRYKKEIVMPMGIKPMLDMKGKKSGIRTIDIYNEQKDVISVFSYPEKTKDKMSKKLGINSLAIKAINKDSLHFYKDFFTYLGYKQVRKYSGNKKYILEELVFCDGGIEFDVFAIGKGVENKEGSGIEAIHPGTDMLFFKVSDKKEVDRFVKDFIKPRKINFRFNNPEIKEGEGEYSIFFDTPEKLTIGIIY